MRLDGIESEEGKWKEAESWMCQQLPVTAWDGRQRIENTYLYRLKELMY